MGGISTWGSDACQTSSEKCELGAQLGVCTHDLWDLWRVEEEGGRREGVESGECGSD